MKLSICIPAFKRVEYLERLLDSIAGQTFKDFEVVITDDSNDASVADLIEKYDSSISNLIYHKNEQVMGTPENWNEAIKRANTEWIKIMHDDDWFSSENSLKQFAKAIDDNPQANFIFSAYNNFLGQKKIKGMLLSGINKSLLGRSVFYLFKEQFIGNPSCTLVRKDNNIDYDKRLKWVVDFDYYIRYLLVHKNFFYIDKALINVGLNEDQVTKYTFRNPSVELPENHLLLRKFGTNILNNIFVYDYYWRMYRNLKIRNIEEIKYFDKNLLPEAIKRMVIFQSKVPFSLLSFGPFSKFLMLISYITNPKK